MAREGRGVRGAALFFGPADFTAGGCPAEEIRPRSGAEWCGRRFAPVAISTLRRPADIPRRGPRLGLGRPLGKEFPMRCLSRICLGLLGLALAIPTAVS